MHSIAKWKCLHTDVDITNMLHSKHVNDGWQKAMPIVGSDIQRNAANGLRLIFIRESFA